MQHEGRTEDADTTPCTLKGVAFTWSLSKFHIIFTENQLMLLLLMLMLLRCRVCWFSTCNKHSVVFNCTLRSAAVLCLPFETFSRHRAAAYRLLNYFRSDSNAENTWVPTTYDHHRTGTTPIGHILPNRKTASRFRSDIHSEWHICKHTFDDPKCIVLLLCHDHNIFWHLAMNGSFCHTQCVLLRCDALMRRRRLHEDYTRAYERVLNAGIELQMWRADFWWWILPHYARKLCTLALKCCQLQSIVIVMDVFVLGDAAPLCFVSTQFK